MEYTLDQLIAQQWVENKAERHYFEKEHRHIARYIRPQLAEFFSDGRQVDRRPAIEVLWDDTAIKACDAWARGVNSMTHNQATDWFSYKDESDEVNDDAEAGPWYAMVNKDLRSELKKSGFYAAALHRLKDVGAFGFGAMYSYEDDNKGHMAFEYVPAPEVYFTLYRTGRCRTFLRPLNLSAIQLEERGIPINKCSQKVQDDYAQKRMNNRHLFLHYVAPKEDLPSTVESNHDYVGVYFEVTPGKVVDQHGFHDMPYHPLNWDPIPQTPYPTGIGYITLPEIRNLNAQRKKFDRILDNESDSPILAPNQDEGKEQARPQAGENIYGGMTGEGRRLYDPLYSAATGSRILKEENQSSREMILEAFHNNLMLMISNSSMTATEVNSRDEKIIQAMGPFIIPMKSDLETCLDRIFHSRMRSGAYDPLPAIFSDNSEMRVELHGILAKAHKKLTSNNITMFYSEAIGTIGQVGAEGQAEVAALNHNEALQHMAEARAIPEGIVPTAQQRQDSKEAEMQAQQRMQAVEAAPGLAKAAKDGAQAMNELGGEQVALAP